MKVKAEDRKDRIFLDYASSTPIAKEVLEAMEPWLSLNFSNPSALYKEALVAKDAVKESRQKIAEFLGAQSKEIIFTASGTESNNLALLGIFEAARSRDEVPHFITSNIEHPAILSVFEEINRRGGEVTILKVNEEGLVSAKDVREALRDNTVLVSIMYANNEIGTIQPIKEIGRVIKDWRLKKLSRFPYLHTDACQAVLYCEMNVLKLGVDLLTLDGIKIYGPRGIGVLFVADGVEIDPVFFGGGQERNLRSGTENVPAIVGMSKALEIAAELKESECKRLLEIRDYAIDKILETFPNALLNGSKKEGERLPNNINVCINNADAEFLVISLDTKGIAASYSSSCRTLKEDSSSYVVEALGKDGDRPDCKNSSLRFTMGRETVKDDIDRLVEILKEIVK
jgi:cysteine desulfurase